MFWEDLRASVGRIKHTNIKHNMYKSEGWKTIIEASFYTKVEIESIDLSVTNGTFVTKYKFLKKLLNHSYRRANIELLGQHPIESTSDSIWAPQQVFF